MSQIWKDKKHSSLTKLNNAKSELCRNNRSLNGNCNKLTYWSWDKMMTFGILYFPVQKNVEFFYYWYLNLSFHSLLSFLLFFLQPNKYHSHWWEAVNVVLMPKCKSWQIYNIRCTKSQNLTVSCLVLQLALCNILKPVIKLRMKM